MVLITVPGSVSGSKTATFEITSNAENSPHEVVYTRTGGEPNISTVFDGDFGNVCLADSATRELRIGNPGSCDLSIDNITSSNSEFDIAQVMSFPLTVSPGGEITVPIEFSPAGDFGPEVGFWTRSLRILRCLAPMSLSRDLLDPSGLRRIMSGTRIREPECIDEAFSRDSWPRLGYGH